MKCFSDIDSSIGKWAIVYLNGLPPDKQVIAGRLRAVLPNALRVQSPVGDMIHINADHVIALIVPIDQDALTVAGVEMASRHV